MGMKKSVQYKPHKPIGLCNDSEYPVVVEIPIIFQRASATKYVACYKICRYRSDV